MTQFTVIKNATSDQFTSMSAGVLFKSHATKDELWDTYIGAFPEGSNPIRRERTEHDCNCCKQFIRKAGNVLAVLDGKLTSIWDITIGGHYQVVVDAMHELVMSKGIAGIFLHNEKHVGTDRNHEQTDNGVVVWEHFHQLLPRKVVITNGTIASLKGSAVTNYQTLKRSLSDITSSAFEIVMELIEQDSIYRGEEHLSTLKSFSKVKRDFEKAEDKEVFLWETSVALGEFSGFRKTVIGTLLVDLSEGTELEEAVRKFEAMVAPNNYQRSSALVTQGMIEKAQNKVAELGIEEALYRRFAVTEDVTINNVLFADSSVQSCMGVFDVLQKEVADKVPNLDRVDEVSIDKFINDILPKAESVELMVENFHLPNFVSLISPINKVTESILKWGNNFTWSYDGEVADSIKDRVKRAGGNVTGDLRCSLSWFNGDDLDIHLIEPCGNHISYSSPSNYRTGGKLDVDMNANGVDSRAPVENITHAQKSRMQEGEYRLYINNYGKRDSDNGGFEVEIEFAGQLYKFEYEKHMRTGQNVDVATFTYSHKHGFKIVKSLPSTQASKDNWGVVTQKFQKVNMMMYSPNHWDGEKTGNKHYFFMLDGCVNPEKARGFYNEFLRNDLTVHRKVFEVLGSKLKTAHSEEQLSGLGFSSTQRNHVLCRVRGSFNRVIKINF